MTRPRCELCVLSRNGAPVVGRGPLSCEAHATPWAIVGESPRPKDIEHGRPFTSADGLLLMGELGAVGLDRPQFSYHNAIACLPTSGDTKAMEAKLKKANKARRLAKQPPLPHPIECCRPKLKAELAGKSHAIATGSQALEALTGKRGIMNHQGTIIELRGVSNKAIGLPLTVAPILSPSFIAHSPKWKPMFRRSLSRAIRWFRGEVLWSEPHVVVNPPLADLQTYLVAFQKQPYVCYDTETDGLESLLCNLRTIQMGTANFVVIIAIRSIENPDYQYYEDRVGLTALLRWAFFEAGIKWVGHNASKYDRMVMEENFARGIHRVADRSDVTRLLEPRERPTLAMDSLLMHRVCDPELPHSLGFVGGFFTDVHNWKEDHTATTARLDVELWRYGALDVAVNARIVPPLDQRMREKDQLEALRWDHKMVDVCCGMHRIGIGIDQERVRAHAKRLINDEQTYEQLVMYKLTLAGNIPGVGYHTKGAKKGQPIFNPRSGAQIAELLFGSWGLAAPDGMKKKEVFTETGERATSDAVLRAYLADRTLTDAQREVIDAIRRCKRVRKAYGTFVKPLIVATGTDWGPFDENIDMSQWPPQKHAMANGRHEDPRLCVWPDGRLRVGWNAHVTTVGRLSCGGSPSRYNLQTVPASLRDMFIPSPGHVFVGADLDQVHLRIIASRWHVPSLLADFAEGRDPHATFAATVFGDKFTSAKGQPCEANGHKFKGLAKSLRNLGKTLRYTGAYGAGVPTIYRTMTRAEDAKGQLLNRDLKLREVRIMHQEWMESEPEWALGWNAEMSSYDANGYLASPIMGRRCDFEDGDAKGDLKTKVSNYATLSGEADVMVPMTYELSQRLPWGFAGPNTGLVGQFHDAMLVECPDEDAERVKTILEETMNKTVPGWVVPITAEADIGQRWSDV